MKNYKFFSLLLIILILAAGTAYSQKIGENSSDMPPVEEMEKSLFAMVNRERVKEGLKPLIFEKKAYEAARNHSADMAKREYFNHNSPEGESVTGRLQKLNFEFTNTGWGENIASCLNYKNPLDVVLKGWMKSPGHRKNILNSKYKYGAIGIARNDKGRYYFTQVFWGPI